MTEFSKWLDEQLTKSGIGVNQLATYTGLSSSGISKLRLGQRNPSPKTLKKLADYFKYDYDSLLMLAGYRSAEDDENLHEIKDPELRAWLTAENINNLSNVSREALLAIIKADVTTRNKNLSG